VQQTVGQIKDRKKGKGKNKTIDWIGVYTVIKNVYIIKV
jgi:hypothetical protein